MSYQPVSPPVSGNPALERYIIDELSRIAGVIEGIREDVYGGLLINAGTLAGTTAVAPQILANWDDSIDDGTQADSAKGEITIETEGAYECNCLLSVEVIRNRRYTIELYKNGAATGILGAVDVAWTTDECQLSFVGLLRCEPGDVLDVRYHAPGFISKFDVVAGGFDVVRV